MGKRGAAVEDARERTIAVLQANDACSEWYEQSNPDVVDVFRSLHYTIEDFQPSYTLRQLMPAAFFDFPGAGRHRKKP